MTSGRFLWNFPKFLHIICLVLLSVRVGGDLSSKCEPRKDNEKIPSTSYEDSKMLLICHLPFRRCHHYREKSHKQLCCQGALMFCNLQRHVACKPFCQCWKENCIKLY
uniref:Cnidarian restricted protein n=1 Tax=Clytia hemisphaerica TaxID=252671 RepID=A0A7M5X281_9CNID